MLLSGKCEGKYHEVINRQSQKALARRNNFSTLYGSSTLFCLLSYKKY